MSMENAIKFYSEFPKDGSKLAQFADLRGKEIDEKVFNERILPAAKQMGLDFTYQELVQVTSNSRELSDTDLENVSGGGTEVNIFSKNKDGKYGCF